jgi:hypothetical protein
MILEIKNDYFLEFMPVDLDTGESLPIEAGTEYLDMI